MKYAKNADNINWKAQIYIRKSNDTQNKLRINIRLIIYIYKEIIIEKTYYALERLSEFIMKKNRKFQKKIKDFLGEKLTIIIWNIYIYHYLCMFITYISFMSMTLVQK